MRLHAAAAPAAVALAGIALGAATVFYVGWAGSQPLKLAVPPLVIALLTLLAVDKRALFLLIMLLRSAADPLLDSAKFTLGGTSMGVGAALNALMIGMAAIYLLERPDVRARIPLWSGLLLILALGWALLSPEPAGALRTLLVLVSYASVFVIAFCLVRDGDGLRSCTRLVLLSSLIPVLYAFVDIAMHWSAGAEAFRLQSSFTHPNIFAFYLLLVIALVLHRLYGGAGATGPGQRWMFWCYMALLLGLLLLTQTRSAWLACLLIFGLYGMLFERRMLLFIGAAALLGLALPEVRERLMDLTADQGFDPYAPLNSFDWRLQIWAAGIAWMQPLGLLIGHGIDAFAHHSQQFFPLAGQTHPGAHNIYVQWFFETGAVGLLCLGWLFACLLRQLGRGFREHRRGTVILISLVLAYLLVGASDNLLDYLAFNWYFWLVMGTACGGIALASAGAHRKAQP